jgi:hypothetical protein
MLRSTLLIAIGLTVALVPPATAQLQVVATTPAANDVASITTAVSVEFDRPLDTATIGVQTFRVFGQRSGAARGTYSFSNGNRTVMLTPDHPFAAGEFVFVNLSHDITAADATTLRAAGYATQFTTAVAASSGSFTQIDTFSNSTGPQTRLYGAAAADLNGDRFIDLATINEVSSDVRVFLSLGDGSGLFGSMKTPQTIGLESSPNDTADFDNDGLVDVCVGAADSGTVSILRGAGDGTFSSIVQILVGDEPHGVATLDVDGDGDIDIVNANAVSNDLSLLLNNGAGTFGSPTFFDSGVNGEWGLTAADMNGDGITDLVVGGSADGNIRTLLGNGNGTFTPAGSAQHAGGSVWAVVVGDLDGDGDLDVATANDGSGTVGIAFNQGNGTFASPIDTLDVDGHTPSVDLGDLDGDGDVDVVASNFGSGYWRRFANDGTGSFSFVEDIPAPSNPSCSILFDADNDGDLDMALTDELAELIPEDNIILMRNGDDLGGGADCSPAPAACRGPVVAGASKLQLKHVAPGDSDKLSWTWTKGAATTKEEFADPLVDDGYTLCLYEDGELRQGFSLPAGQICHGGKPCWRENGKGYNYTNRELNPDGLQTLKLKEGIGGQSKIIAKGRGGHLELPDVGQLTGVLDLQLQRKTGGPCWGATFTPPFAKNDGVTLKATSAPATATTTTTTSTTTTTLAPVWSAIHANVIGPQCGGCHGTNGNLTGLSDCNLGHANLVNVASFRLSTMDRVEPGDPSNSFLMHKLDGTQGTFNAQCLSGSCGSSMPLGSPLLAMSVRDAIRTWITNGAVNDCP